MLWLRWPVTGNGMHLDMVASEQNIPHKWQLNLVWLCAGVLGIMVAWL
jgi:hypothetical protein